ncbi:MAG: hypothetical protein WC508_01780 [Patescibacteria group bacterium]
MSRMKLEQMRKKLLWRKRISFVTAMVTSTIGIFAVGYYLWGGETMKTKDGILIIVCLIVAGIDHMHYFFHALKLWLLDCLKM